MRPSRLAYTCYGWWGSPVRGGVRVAARAAQVKVKARATNKSSNNKCHPALLLFLFFSLLNASFFCLFLFVVFNAYFMVFLVLFLVASKSLSKYLNLFSLSLTFFLSEKNSRFFAYVQCSYSSKSAFFFLSLFIPMFHDAHFHDTPILVSSLGLFLLSLLEFPACSFRLSFF